jgi:hypothetical protein
LGRTDEVARHATSVLCQRYEEERKQSGANVPAACGPVEIRKWLILDVEARGHELVTGAVRTSWQACQDGDEANGDSEEPFISQ